jgi:hypothetical protein
MKSQYGTDPQYYGMAYYGFVSEMSDDDLVEFCEEAEVDYSYKMEGYRELIKRFKKGRSKDKDGVEELGPQGDPGGTESRKNSDGKYIGRPKKAQVD